MITAPAIPSPAKVLGDLLIRIVLILANRVSWSTLSPVLVHQISKRLWRIKHRIDRIAALVADGKYLPRHPTTPSRPGSQAARKPPPQSLPEMRKFNWLAGVIPDIPPLRGAFLDQLHGPEMAALIEAAPGAMIPPLRSICWTLGLRPPPILARPKRPKAPPLPPAPVADQGGEEASSGASESAPSLSQPIPTSSLSLWQKSRRSGPVCHPSPPKPT